MPRAKSLPFSLVLFGTLASPLFAEASDLVVVWLNDGRMLAGEVDPRTDAERLWLRSKSPTFVVATSADWEHIKAVNANGERLPVEAFSQRVDEFRPKQPAANVLPVPARTTNVNETTVVTRPTLQRNAATRVASLDVEARVANWDQDAAIDGVEIRVFPRNTFGEIIPVSGQVTAQLLARNQLPAHDRNAFPKLGRWSIRADTSDFGAYGALYRLPFRGKHPDEEFSLEPHGLVEVSFYVHGQGRFASDATILLRRFNPIRRDIQRHATDRDP
ncbi:MAG: hypothetical protein H8E66_29625 [Planctomycetes bacterium]|nr:hypothetical protein [Planctomycetota bacterium]